MFVINCKGPGLNEAICIYKGYVYIYIFFSFCIYFIFYFIYIYILFILFYIYIYICIYKGQAVSVYRKDLLVYIYLLTYASRGLRWPVGQQWIFSNESSLNRSNICCPTNVGTRSTFFFHALHLLGTNPIVTRILLNCSAPYIYFWSILVEVIWAGSLQEGFFFN